MVLVTVDEEKKLCVAEVLPASVNHFVRAEIRHFDFDAYRDAVDWID